MRNAAINNPSRRKFLRTAPVAAAAGLALTDAAFFTASAAAQTATPAAPAFQLFTAREIHDSLNALAANPGNKSLVDGKNFVAMLTVEKTKSAKEFEWHEGRDHVFQILDGETVYQLGGTPKNPHTPKPGEWLAPESEGAQSLTLRKGDILVVPRGTPHKRSTAGSVTFLLISPQGAASA